MISGVSKPSVRPSPASWRMQGTIGVIVALALILIYVWFRFEWQFAVGAIVATDSRHRHDDRLLLVSGVEFNLSSSPPS